MCTVQRCPTPLRQEASHAHVQNGKKKKKGRKRNGGKKGRQVVCKGIGRVM